MRIRDFLPSKEAGKSVRKIKRQNNAFVTYKDLKYIEWAKNANVTIHLSKNQSWVNYFNNWKSRNKTVRIKTRDNSGLQIPNS